MMSHSPVSSKPATVPATYLTHWLWTNGKAYWPLWLGTLGVLWLGTSLLTAPLNEWITLYERTSTAYKPSNESRLVHNIMQGAREGYEAGYSNEPLGKSGLRIFWYLLGTLLFPFALILFGAGYYLYWHFARNTLFDASNGAKAGFVATFFVIWLFWQAMVASGLIYISPQTVQAGLDTALPTVTLGFWLVQCLVMHVFVRQQQQRELAQQARVAELTALTAQVNPPFIFHALQYLQGAAIAEQLPRTAQSLEQLTGIMQYVLEESRKEITDIAHEIGFIRDYLRLQKLRLPQRDTIQIRTDVSWDGKPAPVVPLLLNPLIENAFKYGISIQHPCFVTVQLHVADGVLHFSSENSILPRTDLEAGTGMGVRNVRKRLRLAYPNRHKLTISEKPDQYRVDLHLELC